LFANKREKKQEKDCGTQDQSHNLTKGGNQDQMSEFAGQGKLSKMGK
jgi:hypothetical protein